MCGIAGFLESQAPGGRDAASLARAMADVLAHRGPDDSGLWTDESRGIALSHRRLAIIDLSAAGHQPMVSASGRFVVILNGEIYNHLALRSELSGYPWIGHSDTETLLAGMDRWGIVGAIERTVGMFALAVWDRERNELTLARDRMGEKPLYYGWQRGVLLFGSELKALREHPAFEGKIDRAALSALLTYGYIPAPLSIYEGIGKLPSGTVATFSAREQAIRPRPYWSLNDAMVRAAAQPFAGSAEEAVDELERRVAAAVKLQLIADVPLGAFLSGGIDSSTVVALMQRESSRPVSTFTIGFAERAYDEAGHARAVARHLGTDHTELYVSTDEAMRMLPDVAHIYDEPLGDASQLPTVLVSRLARRRVTVALSGDGGDELFGGYPHYVLYDRIWRRFGSIPPAVRRLLSVSAKSLPADVVNVLASPLIALRGRKPTVPPGDRLRYLAGALGMSSHQGFYSAMRSQWNDRAPVTPPVNDGAIDGVAGRSLVEHMMLTDAAQYLADDILVKVDRAAMSVSLETRVPLLDHRVVEFALSLPADFKVRDGVGKWLLRQVLYRHVPRTLVDRPKTGFVVPLAQWLRQPPLRDWAESLLSESRLRDEGYLDASRIRARWQQHVSGRYEWHGSLWAVLMFQSWLAEQLPATAAPRAHAAVGGMRT